MFRLIGLFKRMAVIENKVKLLETKNVVNDLKLKSISEILFDYFNTKSKDGADNITDSIDTIDTNKTKDNHGTHNS